MSILRPLIGVINLSKKISNDDVKIMVIACQDQLNKDVAPQWQMDSWFVMFYPDPKTASLRAYPVVILDSPDTPEALGYHAEMNGKPYGRVFVNPILENSGVVLHDPANPQNVSVSSVLSHDIIEMFLDKDASKWVDGPQTRHGNVYACEACDPVQENLYAIQVGKKLVSVSNFILPAWFDLHNSPHTPVDFLNTAPGAFSIAPGGYMIVRTAPGTEAELFATIKMPDWVHAMKKLSASRTTRRLAPAIKPVVEKKKWWKYLF